MLSHSRKKRFPPRTRRSKVWSSGFTVAVLVAVVLGCGGVGEDELACEEAVVQLQDCCPGFTGSRVHCTFENGGCDRAASQEPDISISQSACIRKETCSELRASGVCARALADLPASSDPEEGTQQPEICP
jgi:hypothetical protein